MKRALLISVVALWACDPSVTPIDKRQEQELTATATQTRVVWVLDNSGSMLDKVDPACPGSSCATRIQTVADGLAVMINTAPIDQQIALVFPGGGGQEQCTASRDPYDLTGQNVDTFLRLQAPTGGTPTTEALTKVANIPEPAGTETFVVLVTDGLPNCNPDNPNNICVDTSDEQKNRCRCVSGSCSGQLCSLGCLDEVGVIEASQWFGPHGQQLMAIAFGTDLANLSSPFTSMGVDARSPMQRGC